MLKIVSIWSPCYLLDYNYHIKKTEISWSKQDAEQRFLCSAPPIFAALGGNLAMMLHLLIGSLLTQTRIMDGVWNTYKARFTAAPQNGRGDGTSSSFTADTWVKKQKQPEQITWK